MDDLCESPAIKIGRLIGEKVGEIVYGGSGLPEFVVAGKTVPQIELAEEARRLLHGRVRHTLILDTRNALEAFDGGTVVRL